MTLWNKFQINFGEIINEIEEYKKILNYSIYFNQNLLFYSYIGFPIDLFIDEIIKKKFYIKQIYRKEIIWNKTIIYNENQYFFEIDLDNPNMPRKLNNLNDMLFELNDEGFKCRVSDGLTPDLLPPVIINNVPIRPKSRSINTLSTAVTNDWVICFR
jgi:hypothetical protein